MEKTYMHLTDITMDEDYEWGNAPRYAIKPGFDISDLYGTELIALIESYRRLVNSEILKRNKANNENNDLLNRIAKLEEELKREREKNVGLKNGLDDCVSRINKAREDIGALDLTLQDRDKTIYKLRERRDDLIKQCDEEHDKCVELEKKVAELKGIINRFPMDIASMYPKHTLNLDCPIYAARAKAKYDSLIKAGFTEDQAMAQMPLWTDN